MKIIVFFVAIVKLSSAYSQIPADSVDSLISKINWNSLVIITTYASRLTIDGDAQKLVSLKNPTVLTKLHDNLDIPEKAVAIHMILTKRLEKDKESLSYSVKGDIVNYTYNNLSWLYDTKTQEYSISKHAMSKLKKYWGKRMLK